MAEQKEGAEEDTFNKSMEGMGATAYPNASKWTTAMEAWKRDQEAHTEKNDQNEIEEDAFQSSPPSQSSPRSKRRVRGSASDLATEEVVNELDIIHSEIIETNKILGINNIVMTSMLEQNTQTNKILTQMLGVGGSGGSAVAGGGGGQGGKGGGDGGGNLLKGAIEGGILGRILGIGAGKGAALGAIEGAGGVEGVIGALGLSGLVGAATSAAVPLAGVAAAGFGLYEMGKNQKTTTQYFKDHGDSGLPDVDSDGNTISNNNDSIVSSLDTITQRLEELKKMDSDPSISPEKKRTIDSQISQLTTQQEALNKRRDFLASTDNGGVASGGRIQAVGGQGGGIGLSPVQGGPFGLDPHRQSGAEVMRQATGGQFGPHVGVSSNLSKNQKESYDAAISSGLSDSAARILVANFSGESLSNPGDVHADPSRRNPGQVAQGIASWDQERTAAIRKQFGKDPKDMTVAEQTKASIWEMQQPKYKDAWAALNNESLDTQERMYGLVHKYENPANPMGDTQRRMQFLNGLNTGQNKSDGAALPNNVPGNVITAPKSRDEVLGHLTRMRDMGLISNEQCVSLAAASVGIHLGDKVPGGHTTEWMKGGNISSQTAAGTPISTFEGPQGPSNVYAGGTGGVAGINRDHAAVLTGQYKTDKDGNVTSAEVTDQSKGHGWHGQTHWINKTGPEGTGGEQNLSNYALPGTKGKDGSITLLGGKNNPEYQRTHDSNIKLSGPEQFHANPMLAGGFGHKDPGNYSSSSLSNDKSQDDAWLTRMNSFHDVGIMAHRNNMQKGDVNIAHGSNLIKNRELQHAQSLAQTHYDRDKRLASDPNNHYNSEFRDVGIQAHLNDIHKRKPDFLSNPKYQNLNNNLTTSSDQHKMNQDRSSFHSQHHIVNHHYDQSQRESVREKEIVGPTKPPSSYLTELFSPIVKT